MALSPSGLASLIQSNLEDQGAKGSNLQKFCLAIATGIIEAIVGKSFTTEDVGTISGAGEGTGTGITGLIESTMVDLALAQMTSQGKNAKPLMTAIMDAVISYLESNAILTTIDTPVFIGTGTIVVGSITVMASEMAQDIDTVLQNNGAKGKNRANLALAIATGVCGGIGASGTGTVIITGTGTPTGPGTGTGTGTIS
jgi:hypothetical protein